MDELSPVQMGLFLVQERISNVYTKVLDSILPDGVINTADLLGQEGVHHTFNTDLEVEFETTEVGLYKINCFCYKRKL